MRVGYMQWETESVIYYHESWDELWETFHTNQPEIAERITNKKSLRVHPMVF